MVIWFIDYLIMFNLLYDINKYEEGYIYRVLLLFVKLLIFVLC